MESTPQIEQAKRLLEDHGYLVLDDFETEIYNFGLKKVKDTVKDTNFESEGKSPSPVKEMS